MPNIVKAGAGLLQNLKFKFANDLPVLEDIDRSVIMAGVGTVVANNIAYAGGADKTGAKNSSDAIMAAANSLVAGGMGGVVLLQPGTYKIDKTVVLPSGVFIAGIGGGMGCTSVKFVPVEDGTYIGGWMFMFNSTNGTTAASNIYHRQFIGGMMGCAVDNYSTEYPGIRGIICFGSGLFTDLRFYKLLCSIKRPADYYVDRWTILRCYVDQELLGSTEYQFDLDGSGDCIVIDQCTFPVGDSYQTTPMKAIRIRNTKSLLSSASATVRNCINGKHYFKGVKSLKVEGIHQEFGDMTFDCTNYSLENSYISVHKNHTSIPIRHVADPNYTSMYIGNLKNVEFLWGFGNFKGSNLFDIQTTVSQILNFENCSRVIDVTGASPQPTGIRVCESNSTNEIANWKKNAHLLSKSGTLNGYQIKNAPHPFTLVNDYGGIFYIAVQDTGESNTWDKPTGTYHYDAQYLIDSTRMVGLNSTGAAVSVNVATAAGSVVNMNTNCGSNLSQCIIRVYRGTSANSYSEYADIPSIAAKSLYDTGSMINGVPWISRTAGVKDTLKSSRIGDWIVYLLSNIKRLDAQYVPRAANGAYGLFGGHQINEFVAPLTSDVYLGSPANAQEGDTVRVTRSAAATGAFNVVVQGFGSAGSTSKNLAVNQWLDLHFNGTYWSLLASGSL